DRFTEEYMLKLIGIFVALLLVPILAVALNVGDASCPPNQGFGPDWMIVKVILLIFFMIGPAIAVGLRNSHGIYGVLRD
ncbi:hypothetical protein HDU93_002924, partial [Gonapodya sp. JEL0774]